MLTPDYASPEQIRGDGITVASDVYSLAAVLYELLTGAKPHRIGECTPQAIERAICDEEIVRPSKAADEELERRLRGDLDTILLRALQKEPTAVSLPWSSFPRTCGAIWQASQSKRGRTRCDTGSGSSSGGGTERCWPSRP